jgi:tight adherence protein B
MELWIGFITVGAALALAAAVLLGGRHFARSRDAAHPTGPASLRLLGLRAADLTDRTMRRRGWSFAGVDQLELAGLTARPGAFVVAVVLLDAALALVATVLAFVTGAAAGWLFVVVAIALVPIVARMYLARRTAKRRAAFADQLDDTLQLIASGLRAGHSLARAIDAVSREAESPTAEEFARIINENRLGRDLGEAIALAAQRMKSDDLAWTAQAVDIHREVGGNLSEVLDHVAETIRERNQIRRQVATLSAEGRVSANVLMALPVVIAAVLTVISPKYLTMFVTTPVGVVLLVICAILFIVGALWLRAITRIRF